MDRTVLKPGFEDYLNSRRSAAAIQDIANMVKNTARNKNYDDKKTVELVVSFVQNIKYMSDEESTAGRYVEYYKFPYETLYDNAGDCEDT